MNFECTVPADAALVLADTVCPATQKDFDKHREQEVFLVRETAQAYRDVSLPYINSLKPERCVSVCACSFACWCA